MIELILGGARSGKSRLAEARALESGKELIYVATATAGDPEMEQRIQRHRKSRDEHWRLVEEPLALADALSRHAAQDRCILVDCLTLWLSNLLHTEDTTQWQAERKALLDTLPSLPGQIILVSNEVGMGIVPMGELTRQFVDESGWLHQDLAAICDRVTLTVAGLPHCLKDNTSAENTYE